MGFNSKTQTFDTIADLKTRSGTGGSSVTVLGYYEINDGGGGQFYYDADSSATDDGGLNIKPTAVSGNGRWKRIVPENNVYNIKWWGATGLGYPNNDYPFFQAALDSMPERQIASLTNSKGTLIIPQPEESYYLSQGLLIEDNITILGSSTTTFPFSTCTLEFAVDSFGINFLMSSPGSGAKGCYISNLYLFCRGTSTGTTKHGLEFNAQTVVDGVYADGFGGYGIYPNTTVYGNCNGSRVINCGGTNNQLGGIYCDGGESSIIHFENSYCQFNGGCNIRDNGFLGNNFFGGHLSGSGFRVGIISNNWAKVGSNYYVCKKDNINKQPTVAVDWEDYWEDVGTGVEVPDSVVAWSAATNYKLSANFAFTGEAQAGLCLGMYCEAGSGTNINLSVGSLNMGGAGNEWFQRNMGSIRYFNGYVDCNGEGWSTVGKSNQNVYTRMGADFGLGAGSEIIGNAGFMNWAALEDRSISAFFPDTFTTIPSLYWPYKSLDGTPYGRTTIFAGCTTIGRRGLFLQDVSDATSSANKRMVGSSNAPPISDGSFYGKGDFVFNNLVTTDDPTLLGWRCTEAGSPGTWVAVTTSPESYTISQRNALTPYLGQTIFCTDATASDASTGVIQTWSGVAWKNHW